MTRRELIVLIIVFIIRAGLGTHGETLNIGFLNNNQIVTNIIH